MNARLGSASARAFLAAGVLVVAATARAEIRHESGKDAAVFGAFLEYGLLDDDEALDRALRLGGESSFLTFEQAYVALRRGDNRRMIERAERAAEIDPKNGEAQALLGRVYFRLVDEGLAAGGNHLRLAIQHAEAAMDLGTAEPELLDRLAAAHGASAARAESERDWASATASRARQRRVLETWAARYRHELPWQRMAEMARDVGDREGEARALEIQHRRGGDPLVVQALAETLRRLGRCEAAVPLLTSAASDPSLDKYGAITVNVNLGECAQEVGPLSIASAAFSRAIEADPTNALAAFGLAEVTWDRGDHTGAREQLSRFGERVSADDGAVQRLSAGAAARVDFLAARTRWNTMHGLMDEAVRDARKTVALVGLVSGAQASQAAEVQALLGEVLLRAGDFEGAAVAGREALAKDPSSIAGMSVVLDAAWLLDRPGDAKAAIAAFEKRAPGAEALTFLARWEVGHGASAAAAEHARRALVLSLGTGRVGAASLVDREPLLASILLDTGHVDEAISALREALGRHPFDLDTAFLLADALAVRGKVPEAQDVLAKAEQSAVRDAWLLERLSRWESAHRLNELARQHARQALDALEPGAGDALRARFEALVGQAALMAGDNAEAATWLGRAMGRDVVAPSRRVRALATALERSGRIAEAVKAVSSASSADPDDVDLALERGRLLVRSGEVTAGSAVVLEAVRSRKDLVSLPVQAARILAEAGAPAQARQVMDEALQRFGSDPLAWVASGALFEKQGRVDEAEAHFRKALALDEQCHAALNALGYMLAARGLRVDESVRLTRRAVELRPDEAAYLDSLGWALLQSGNLDEAKKTLTAALMRDRDPVIVMHVGTLEEKQGRQQEALDLYREALRSGLTEDTTRVESRVHELAERFGPKP